MNKVLNIVNHSSDLFAPVLATSMASILENNKSMEEIHVYVFENPLSDENKARLTSLAESYGRNVHFIKMPDVNAGQRLGLKAVKDGWFFNSYMKLFLDDYLPSNIERILYLDSDILVVDDLTDLINTDMEGCCAAGVIDALGEKYYKLLGLNENARYCNSGMILEDLTVWRKKNIGDRIRKYCKENGGYVFFMEQTAFNAVLQGEGKILHPKYNTYSMMQCMSYDELYKLRRPERFYTREEIAEAVAKPAIIHLTNSFLLTNRAWYENTNHPERERYKYYQTLTPWKDEPGFPDKRDWKKKCIQKMIDMTPRSILLPIVELVYNNWRVNKIQKLIDKYRQE